MTQDIVDKRITLNVTPREAQDFLIKLSTDDKFRSRLGADPGQVLAEYHIYIPLEQIPGAVVLPPKEVLQRALANFTEYGEIDFTGLLSPAGWPFMLFWWLYMTPAKPRRRTEGGSDVEA
jgi:hypothetical protein